LEDVVDRHNLRRFMTFNTKCALAQWNEDLSKWKVVLHDLISSEEKTIFADVFVYAVGRLNNYKFPKIAGQKTFRGVQVHTANWPSDMTVKDKQVIVIGNGASAVQCVAALQPGESQSHPEVYHADQFVFPSCLTNSQHCPWPYVDSTTCSG
jgi:cation diffusion facilitator CzcD-associated flavoprotein CzcO